MGDALLVNCYYSDCNEYKTYTFDDARSMTSDKLTILLRNNGLSQENIRRLKLLAAHLDDKYLLSTIADVTSGKPSLSDIKFCDDNIYEVLRIILDIGMYICGWKGPTEPYIIYCIEIRDKVKLELDIYPLLDKLIKHPEYSSILNLPIVTYKKEWYTVPVLDDINDIISNYIDKIINGDFTEIGIKLIATAYYYINAACNVSLPMIEPILINTAK